MADLGDLFVNIMPDMDNFGEELSSQVSDAAASAGEAAGEALSSGAAEGAAGLSDSLSGEFDKVGEAAGSAVSDGISSGATEGSESLASGLQDVWGDLGAVVGAVFAGAIVKKSLDSFAAVAKASQTLEFGLSKIGQGANLDALVDWAGEFSLATGIGEAQVITMTSKLVNLGGAFFKAVGPDAVMYIEQLVEGLTDLSAATGKPVAGLMRSLGPNILNTPEKAVGSLTKMGALTQAQADHVKELVAEDKKLAATQEILNIITEKYAGAAESALTPSAKWDNMMNQTSITIGRVLNPVLDGLVNILGDAAPVFLVAASAAGGLLKVMLTLGASNAFAFIGRIPGNAAKAITFLAGLATATTGVAVSEGMAAAAASVQAISLEVVGDAELIAASKGGVLAAANTVTAASFYAAAVAAAAFALAAVAIAVAAVKVYDYLKMDDEKAKEWSASILDGTETLSQYGAAVDKITGDTGLSDMWNGDRQTLSAYHQTIQQVYDAMAAVPGVLNDNEKATIDAAIAAGDFDTVIAILDGHMKEYAKATKSGTEKIKDFMKSHGRLNQIVENATELWGQQVEAGKTVEETIENVRTAWDDWAVSTGEAINFVILNLGNLLTNNKLTFEQIIKQTDKSHARMKEFWGYLEIIARDADDGKDGLTKLEIGAKQVVDELTKAGPSALHSAKEIATGSVNARRDWERGIGDSVRDSTKEAGSLETALVGAFHEMTAAILIATGEAKNMDDALNILDGKHVTSTVEIDAIFADFAPINDGNPTHQGGPHKPPGGSDGNPNTPKAKGGPIDSGETYLVGEEGPELFQSDKAGKIIPNHELVGKNTAAVGTVGNLHVTWGFDKNGMPEIRKIARDEIDRSAAWAH